MNRVEEALTSAVCWPHFLAANGAAAQHLGLRVTKHTSIVGVLDHRRQNSGWENLSANKIEPNPQAQIKASTPLEAVQVHPQHIQDWMRWLVCVHCDRLLQFCISSVCRATLCQSVSVCGCLCRSGSRCFFAAFGLGTAAASNHRAAAE